MAPEQHAPGISAQERGRYGGHGNQGNHSLLAGEVVAREEIGQGNRQDSCDGCCSHRHDQAVPNRVHIAAAGQECPEVTHAVRRFLIGKGQVGIFRMAQHNLVLPIFQHRQWVRHNYRAKEGLAKCLLGNYKVKPAAGHFDLLVIDRFDSDAAACTCP